MPNFLLAPSALSELKSESVTIKVSNIPLKADKSFLTEFFLECGDIQSITFSSHVSGLNLPSKKAQVKFSTKEGAEKAIKLSGKIHEDRHIQVEPMFAPMDYDHTILVSNISKTATEEKLWRLFEKFGTVISLSIGLGKKQDTMHAKIVFESKEARRLAVKEHISLSGRVLKVIRKISPEKKEKKIKEKLEKIKKMREEIESSNEDENEAEDWDMNPIDVQEYDFKNIRTYNSKKKIGRAHV